MDLKLDVLFHRKILLLLRENFTVYCQQLGNLKGQCPDYAHARASSVFSSKDNRTVKLTRQDFLPDRTADRDLLFIFSSNILDFPRSLSSYIKIWLAVRSSLKRLKDINKMQSQRYESSQRLVKNDIMSSCQ